MELYKFIKVVGNAFSQLFIALIPSKVTHIFTKKQRLIEKAEQVHEKRPELKITAYRNYLSRNTNYGVKKKCDLGVMMAFFDSINLEKNDFKHGRPITSYKDKFANVEDWRCVLYKLQNVGKTAISHLAIISATRKELCVFDSDLIENMQAMPDCLDYDVFFGRKIYPGDSYTLKLCYNVERVKYGLFFASLFIVMTDDNGRRWAQALFAPEEKIQDSFRVSEEWYRNRKQTKDIEERIRSVYKRKKKWCSQKS